MEPSGGSCCNYWVFLPRKTPALLEPITAVIMATPPRHLWKAGGWRFLLICSFFPPFSDHQGGPSTPCWGKWGEWPGGLGGRVGQRAAWAGPRLRPPQSRTTSGLDSHCYEAAKREVFGSFLTKDKQELIWTDSRRHNGFWKVFSLQEKIEMWT